MNYMTRNQRIKVKNTIIFLSVTAVLFSCQSDIETVQEKPVSISPDSETKYLVPPVRPITHGPKYHWFGYYDKLQFDPTCRYVLGMEVDFEDRSPEPDDVIKIGMVDLEDNDRLDRIGGNTGMELAAGLYAAMAARFRYGNCMERP